MKKKLAFFISINFILAIVAIGLLFKINEKVKINEKEESRRHIPIERKIIELINEGQPKTKTEFIDAVRRFVYENSINIYKKPSELSEKDIELGWKMTYALKSLYLSKITGDGEPARLACGPRALAMSKILDEAGVQSRIVDLISDDFDYLAFHTLLEVFNPESQRWEIQDPDSNSYYINKKTQKRASIAEMILDNPDDFFLISDEEKESDWQETIRTHYFEGAAFLFGLTQNSKSVVIYNPERLSLEKNFPDEEGPSLKETLEKKYENPAIILNPGNSEEFESIANNP